MQCIVNLQFPQRNLFGAGRLSTHVALGGVGEDVQEVALGDKELLRLGFGDVEVVHVQEAGLDGDGVDGRGAWYLPNRDRPKRDLFIFSFPKTEGGGGVTLPPDQGSRHPWSRLPISESLEIS